MACTARKMYATGVVPTLLTMAALAGCGSDGDNPPPEPPLASGARDLAYGGGGKVTIARPSWTSSMAVAQDGTVFVANEEAGQGIVKLDTLGNIAPGYGAGGRVDLPSSSPVLDGQGNLYVITTQRNPRSIAKLDASGQLDPTFGDGGHAALPAWSQALINTYDALARDGSGNLYVAGTTGETLETTRTAIAKYDPQGRRATYGIGGALVVNTVALPAVRFRAMAVDSQGNAYLGLSGVAAAFENATTIVRVDNTGTSAELYGLSGPCSLMDIALETPTRLVIGGVCNGSPSVRKWERGPGVLAFRSVGMREGLFGPIGIAPGSVSRVIAVGDQVYAAGRNGCSGDYAVAKLDANGDPVPSFGGSQGYVLLPGPSDGVRNIALDGRGRLYIGGPGDRACVNSHPTSSAFHVFRVGG